MLVYLSVATLIIIGGSIFYKEEKPARGTGIFYVVLTLILGLRAEMSTDHSGYLRIFNMIASTKWDDVIVGEFQQEKGFMILNKLISFISTSPVFYALVIAAITIGFYFLVFRKRTNIAWLAILLFFVAGEFFESFNLMRQVMAASICLYATKYINQKKTDFFKFVFFVLVAASMHTSAFVMIPAYFIMKLKFTRKTLLVYGIAGIASYLFLPSVINLFTRFLTRYTSYKEYETLNANINYILPTIAMFVFVMACVFIFKVDFDQDNYDNRVILHGAAIAVILAVLGTKVFMAYRLALYFKAFAIMGSVNVIGNIKNSKNKVIFVFATTAAAVAYLIVTMSESPYSPYILHSSLL